MPIYKLNTTGTILQATVEFMQLNYPENYEEVKQVIPVEWELIKQYRTKIQEGGVEVGGKWFNSDSNSKIQQLGFMMMGSAMPQGLQWKTMDGTFVTMTPELVKRIFFALAQREQAIFSNAEIHRAALMKSVAPSSYNFTTGWPSIYVEKP